MATVTVGSGEYAEQWEQTGGDVDAAGESAEFSMVRADGREIKIVEIVNVCSSTGEPSCEYAAQYGMQGTRAGEHYHADEFSFDYDTESGELDNVDLAEACRALESMGQHVPQGLHHGQRQTTWEDLRAQYSAVEIAQACFRYGSHRDPRQPDSYADEYGSDFPTLKAAMDGCGVPQGALWRPEEYDRTWEHDGEE